MALSAGTPVPDLTLTSTSGTDVALKELERAIIYFYPKDMTPGCTAQACGFRDLHEEIRQAGWAVYGISTDPIASHEKFIAKHSLPFELLADPNHEAAEAFDVWAQKSMFGNTFFSAKRVTFAIENGEITQVWEKVDAKNDAKNVLEWIGSS